MKKIIKKILLIFLAIVILEFVVYLLKNKHNINYNVLTDSKNFFVEEKFFDNNYYFDVKIDNTLFSFFYENKFYKTKRVIDNIYYYEKDDLKCIYPVLKNNNYLNIICSKDNILYSYSYFENELEQFVNIIKEKGCYNKLFINKEKKINFSNITIFQDNILDDTYIYIWKYNGFYTLTNKKINQLNLFTNDTYLNKLGINISKYYIIPNYDKQYEYDKFYIINMKNNNIKELKFKKNNYVTNDYYINGVVNNNLYIFDTDNLIQYKINPRRNKYEIVGNQELDGLYYNNGWQKLKIYDFKENKITFDNSYKVPSKIKNYDNIFNYKDSYYYSYNNNYIYYNDTTKDFLYLFNLGEISNVMLVEDTLYFIKDNALYYYNMKTGIKKIVIYDDLAFNKINRYDVYKK